MTKISTSEEAVAAVRFCTGLTDSLIQGRDRLLKENEELRATIKELRTAAAMNYRREDTEAERQFLEDVKAARSTSAHVQKSPREIVGEATSRLYTVTTIAPSDRFGGQRTPVICDSFERAKQIVETNEGDIWECSYYFVVIEVVFPNYLYSSADAAERYWYRYNTDDECYEPIECPDRFESIYGFGIG